MHRLIMPVFLHLNIWHIAWNMIALVMLGNSTEFFFGPYNFFVLLVMSGLGGNLFSAALGDK